MCILNRRSLAGGSGSGMYIRFSNLRITAGSKSHGVFVAPKHKILLFSVKPCIWTRSSVFTRLSEPESSSPRFPAILSISSMKTIDGVFSLASWNKAFTSLKKNK